MKLSDIHYPAETRQAVRDAVVREAAAQSRRRPWWRRPMALSVAGLALAGSTAAVAYVAFAPVEDKRDIRCYYRADLTATYPSPHSPGNRMEPYLLAGAMDEGFNYDAEALQGDPNAGKKQISDPIGLCAFNWDQGLMNPGGITDDLIPPDYQEPAPAPAPTGTVTDAQGNPGTAFPNTFGPGHFVPELRACVVDNTVAVIPGPADACSRLGIPVLEK